MPSSSAEREFKLLEARKRPKVLAEEHVPDLGLTVRVSYDPVNDVLAFDFGLSRQTIDLPEPDGRFVWKVDPETDTVTGFEILEAKQLDVSEVHVNIQSRKEDIERSLRRLPQPSSCGRPTRPLITSVAVKAKAQEPQTPLPLLKNAIDRFKAQYCC
jgi:formate dehydrogenase assembly factor FdhD